MTVSPAATDPPRVYLDFEQALAPLDTAIATLRDEPPSAARTRRLRQLRAELRRVGESLLGGLTPWERVQLSRHPGRPALDQYLRRLFRDFVELHGDRLHGDDRVVIGGLARFRGRAVVVVGQQRLPVDGAPRAAGMPRPEGYRKAVRLFDLAGRYGRPVVTFVDTQGAYPGVGAEARGQAEAIAASLRTLATVPVPVVSVIIGEGGSGGALALALADRVLMQAHAWYSVISPEGCASILFRSRTPEAVARSAALLRLTAEDLAAWGFVDEIVPEPGGGAHREPARAASALGRALDRQLRALAALAPATVVARRYQRYRRLGQNLAPVGPERFANPGGPR
jgi:acetyl-CoA carboxylase carboxyl transferase subunit alpha